MQLLIGGMTYLAVLIAWVFFRAQSFQDAWLVLGRMFGLPVGPDPYTLVKNSEAALVFALTAGMLGIHAFMRNTTLEAVAGRTPLWLRAIVLAGMLYAILTTTGDQRSFIYFQF